MINQTDHKLHVRVNKLVNPYLARLVSMCMNVGYVEIYNTENYTNFYVYVDKSRNKAEQQNRLEQLFKSDGYILK